MARYALMNASCATSSRVRRIAQIPGHQLYDLVLVLAHQQVKGGFVASLDALHQAQIASVHAQLQASGSPAWRSPGMQSG